MENLNPQNSSMPETAELNVFWQKAEAALSELENVNSMGTDESHLAFLEQLYRALQSKDNEVFTNLVVNEWVRFQGSHHAETHEMPAVTIFLQFAAKLENWDSPD